ncbi:MAG: sulfatase-like hydrolase/transferase [Chitinophagaceae bacterium]
MNVQKIIFAHVLFVIAGMLLFFNEVSAQQMKHINVVFILSDDQRYNTIHGLGNPDVITPNLDNLVRNGFAFTRAHIMGGRQGAICAPSRAMIMTGTYANHLTGDGTIIPEKTKTFPELLRAAGYTTFATGKWHSDKTSYNRLFSSGENIFFGGMHMPEAGGQEHPQLFHYDPSGRYPDSSKWKGDHYSSQSYTEAAVEFINKQKGSEKPFLCYVSFTSPHDPRTPPKTFRDMYVTKKIPLPKSFMAAHPFDNGELEVRDENLLPHPRTQEAVIEELTSYYAMITEMDSRVGVIIEALKANGFADNTLIVFAGDNGLAVGNHGLLGKQNLYDHSIRVPLIFSGPGVPKNKTSAALCYLPDINPTVMDYLAIPKAVTVESKSLKPIISGSSKKIRDDVYFLYRNFQRGIRTIDNWKLILYNVKGIQNTQLFNCNTDPDELHNLANSKSYQAKVAALKGLLAKEMEAYGDNLDITKPGWGVNEARK